MPKNVVRYGLLSTAQIGLFRSIFSWLKLGSLFVGTLAKSDEEFQVEKDWFGALMYWSSFDAETYRKLIVESGFVIEFDVVETLDDPNSETEKEIHLWMVVRRPE